MYPCCAVPEIDGATVSSGAAGRTGWLAGLLLHLTYGVRFTDMSPFRAIRVEQLCGLQMSEPTYGWNLEMQMRAAAAGFILALAIAVGLMFALQPLADLSALRWGHWVGLGSVACLVPICATILASATTRFSVMRLIKSFP